MNNILTVVIIFMANALVKASANDHIGILYGKATGTAKHESYCIMFNPRFEELPDSLDTAETYEIGNLNESYVCNTSEVSPQDVKNKASFVSRGNCSFSEKAKVVQKYGAKALIVVSDTGVTVPAADKESDYNEINISVSLMDRSDFEDLMSLGEHVVVKLYAPPSPHIDWNLVVIWLLAVGTVCAGAFWSGVAKHQQYMSRRRPSRAREQAKDGGREEEESEDKAEDNFDMSPKAILVFVILMCGMLVSLYFFYDYLVYAVIGMFTLAASIALFSTLSPVVTRIPCFGGCKLPANKIPILRHRPEVRLVVLYLLCAGFAIWWAVERNKSYAWILQDILGVVFCVHMMKTIRLPSFMACTILLGLLLIYDVFFVFITPLFTKSGDSIMVDVATGGSSKSGEMLPMVLKVPRITQSALSICQLPYSLLGFGDILVPGLLVSYCHGFDLKVNSKRMYFIANMIAYGVGLVLTFVALAMMNKGQPALLYLVPCTLLTTTLVGACRGELRHLWTGKLKSTKPTVDTTASTPTANGAVNSEDLATGMDSQHRGSLANGELSSGESDCEQPLLVNK